MPASISNMLVVKMLKKKESSSVNLSKSYSIFSCVIILLIIGYLSFQPLEFFVQSAAPAIILLILVCLFRRITIQPFSNELAKSQLAATAASTAKNNFISNMSHELRTPMNGIIGMSQILRNSGKLKGDELEQINMICRSSESLLLIIDDLINFSEIGAHKITIEEVSFDVRNLIEDAANITSPVAYSKGLEIIIDIDNAVPQLLIGSPTRIRQVLTKLINNSIKFTDHGKILISVKLEESTGEISFNVTDNGIGLHKEEIEKMFSAFTQVDMSTTKKYGGAGLGLFICKELVELMHGKIGVKSEYQKGSTFYFTLPLKIADQSSHNHSDQLNDLKILLCEDNDVNIKVVQMLLRRIGITPDVSKNGQEAVDKFLHKKYDLILMDCMMPVMDGFQATEKIREIEKEQGIVKQTLIFALTANVGENDKKKCLASGMNDFLPKPIRLETFEEIFKKYHLA